MLDVKFYLAFGPVCFIVLVERKAGDNDVRFSCSVDEVVNAMVDMVNGSFVYNINVPFLKVGWKRDFVHASPFSFRWFQPALTIIS